MSDRVYADPYEDPDRVPRALRAGAKVLTDWWAQEAARAAGDRRAAAMYEDDPFGGDR